ncbi:MAG: Ig-like domain-containing protein [Candidatus Peribacteria bacterium]|jgi:uncharacterized protein YjdB|nr:Ig-like domain-containing protein [Candidatus Peribacteria bacterium]
MKKLFFLLVMSTMICLQVQAQITDTIQFTNCTGKINAPGTWGILSDSIASCVSENILKVNVNRIIERTSDTTKMGRSGDGPYDWIFPVGYSGGSSSSSQAILLSNAGPYAVLAGNGTNESIHIYASFLSDPFVMVDGVQNPNKKHLIDWTNTGNIIIPADTVVTLELDSIFLPPTGINQILQDANVIGQNESCYQITSSGNYTLRTYALNNTGGMYEINFQVTINPPSTHTITATAGSNGTINPNGAVTVPHAENQTFTCTAADCYEIDQVLVDNVNVPSAITSGTYTFTNVASDHTIHVTFKQKPNLTIIANTDPNGTISPSGSVSVPCGDNQTFTFSSASTYYEIDQVLVDNVNVPNAVASGTYTFTNVTSNHTIYVTFKLKQYTVIASAGIGGTIDPNGIITVNHETSQTFNFLPYNGFTIDEVRVDNVSTQTGTSYTFTNVTSNHTISVTFKVITVPVTGVTLNKFATGLLIGKSEYLLATVLPTNATNQNVYWVSNNSNIVTVDQYGKITGIAPGWTTVQVFTQEGNCYATCSVEVNTVPIPVTEVTLNYINWSANAGDVPLQLIATITPTNATNQQVTWHSTNSSVASVLNGWVTFLSEGTAAIVVTTEDGNKTATCHIIVGTPQQYTITVETNNEAWGTVIGGGFYHAGNPATVIATPNQNCHFVRWTENGGEVSTNLLYTFTVTGNRNLTAHFEYYNRVDENDPNAVQVYYHSGMIYLRNVQPGSIVQVIDLLGRVVYQTNPTGERIAFSGRGVYVVRLLQGTLQHTKKIMAQP